MLNEGVPAMPAIVSRSEWLAARKAHLVEEKEFTRARDALSARRRELPWVRVDGDYVFEGPDGAVSLADLFGGKGQLIVQHFMMGPGWQAGCPSCSYWADGYNGFRVHIEQRDAAFVTISNATFAEISAFKTRMGWTFPWVSAHGNTFNRDFGVSFTDEERETGSVDYNYRPVRFPSSEAPGVSVFALGEDGEVYHTYSTYSRGLDMLNGAYHYLDILPKGRDEDALQHPMAWVKRRDEY
jgi:predicted dithiol-disulfide oxidoreductase (DUF899 family)